MSSASKTRTLRARRAVLVLVLLACSSSPESSPPAFAFSRFGEAGSAQANSLTVLFSPSAGTFTSGTSRDPDFRSRYRACFKALLNKEFSAANLDSIVDGMASQVGDAADRNFRRWVPFPPQGNSHAAEIALLKDFLRRRLAWITTQLDTNF